MWSERGERIATGAERPRNDTVTRSVWSGRTESSAPTEWNKKCGGAGRCRHRPLRMGNKRCGGAGRRGRRPLRMGYKGHGRRADVGSELSAAGGRGSEVSEWPRSKFQASAVRQRGNFGHRNRIIGPYGRLQGARWGGRPRGSPLRMGTCGYVFGDQRRNGYERVRILWKRS